MATSFAPQGVPSSQVEIYVSCQNLENKDVLSKSDPFVVCFIEQRNEKGKFWRECGRTETAKDDLSPKFVTPFKIDYRFEELQNLKFEVYDSDSSSRQLQEHDFLGHCLISLGSMMGEHCGAVTKPLTDRRNGKLTSSISFLAEEMNENKDSVIMQFRGSKLDKKDFLGSSDPFLIVYRQAIENNQYMAVHKTEVIKNNLNPLWRRFEIPLATLCNCDKLRTVKIECFDWDSDGSHDLIGACEFNVENMLGKKDFPLDLINPKKKAKKKRYKNSGTLSLEYVEVVQNPSFLNYITGGIELCFHVAIDFTGSNGAPQHPTSLHYLDPNGSNSYVQALFSVGKICEDYDSDKLMPAYGFGAKIGDRVYHDFHLNQMQNPDCYGVMGVYQAYQRFLPTATLYGPTNFSPIINLVTTFAKSQRDFKKYHILLILTDGVITDMDATKAAIIDASHYPMSIIIAGIGNADFGAMEELDSDEGTLRFNGRSAEQDIVQFVPLNKYRGMYDSLAAEVLREVPKQLTTFMKKHGVKPEPRVDYAGGIPPMAAQAPPPNNTFGAYQQPPPQQLPPNNQQYPGQAPQYPNQGVQTLPGQGVPPTYPGQGAPAGHGQGAPFPPPGQGGPSFPGQASVPYPGQPSFNQYPGQAPSAPYPGQGGAIPAQGQGASFNPGQGGIGSASR